MSCDGGVCRTIVYADSLTPVSNDTTASAIIRPMSPPSAPAIAKIAASPCEILLTPHPSASDMPKRAWRSGEPLLDPDACRELCRRS